MQSRQQRELASKFAFQLVPFQGRDYPSLVSTQLTILGSGSSGNCAYLETPETRILVDAGFSGRQTRQRLAEIGKGPEGLAGILITHEHSDHIGGLLALAGKLSIPIFCNRDTRDAIQSILKVKFDCRLFTSGDSFELGDVRVDTFPIPHDASDPVGFLLRTPSGNVGFLTDLGHATKLALQRVREANVLILESNHDLKMLQESSRPWSLKQRIAGRHGHLSNTDAADAAQEIMSADLRHIYLGHLSRECNRPELALEIMSQRLEKIGANHVKLELTAQHQACASIRLEPVIRLRQATLL